MISLVNAVPCGTGAFDSGSGHSVSTRIRTMKLAKQLGDIMWKLTRMAKLRSSQRLDAEAMTSSPDRADGLVYALLEVEVETHASLSMAGDLRTKVW